MTTEVDGRIRYVDVTTRDAHQCLWATRMTNEMILPFASRMDRMGFDWINLIGGAVFDVCVRYLREDPWERMRLVTERVVDTPVDAVTRGQSLYTFEFFADDVVELNMRCLARNGMKRVTLYDALNDTRNLKISIDTAHDEGMHVCGGLVYTVSPVHTDELFAQVANELVRLGVDSVYIKDPSGLLVPDRVKSLVPSIKRSIGETPLELHSHSLSGLAEINYLEAVPLGVTILHTAISPLASGASLPPTEYCVKHLGQMGFKSRLSLEKLAEMADYFTGVARRYDFPLAVPHRYDPALYRHQVPGGMVSNLRNQLREMGMEDREEQILEEAERVRIDLGYPILVSPFAQFVITQALLNVVQAERYKTIPIEVCRYALGLYGRPTGPIAAQILERAVEQVGEASEPFTGRAGDLILPQLPRIRRERGPFDSDEDLLLAAFYSDQQLGPLLQNRGKPYPVFGSDGRGGPLLELLSALARDDKIIEISIQKSDFRLHIRH